MGDIDGDGARTSWKPSAGGRNRPKRNQVSPWTFHPFQFARGGAQMLFTT